MARGEFVLNIGDDNVVLTRITDGKVANAWLGSPDPAMAQEELGEAFAQDPKCPVSVLFDTLDQSFKEEELPRVSVLDRRKVLARHINMAFPGANLRGARLVKQTEKKTLIYEMASVPLDGRVPGWLDVVQALPNEKGGIYTIAAENVDLLSALIPKDATAPDSGNHWRHFIGINVTGGLRQIIEKNGRLSLTRLTQAPPPETSPEEFADMISRDFKATITYIRRLGYQVNEILDLVILTSNENKRVLEDMTWDGARSVSVYTPYEAGMILGLGSLGREDQAYCDVLHAAWFASKKRPMLPMSRSAALGDARDDLRELSFLVAPYAAGLLVAATVGWSGWTGYELIGLNNTTRELQNQYAVTQKSLADERAKLGTLAHEPETVRNVIGVSETLDAGKVDVMPILARVASALEGDAIVLNLEVLRATATPAAGGAPAGVAGLSVEIELRLADIIATADEAVQTARRLQQRLNKQFAQGYTVTMVKEPVSAQSSEELNGSLDSATEAGTAAVSSREAFYAGFKIVQAAP